MANTLEVVEESQIAEKSVVLRMRQLLEQQAHGEISKAQFDEELEQIWSKYYQQGGTNKFIIALRKVLRELFPSLNTARSSR